MIESITGKKVVAKRPITTLVRPRTERKSMLGRRRDTPRVIRFRLRKGPKYKVTVKNKIFFLFSLLSV